MQSVFSLAARQRAVPVLRDVRGRDGELKTDWTKPRAAAPIYGDCFRGPDIKVRERATERHDIGVPAQ